VLTLLVWAAVAVLALPTASLLVLIAIFARLAGRLSELQQGYQQILHMLPAYAGFRRLEQACIDAAEPPTETVPPPSLSRELGLHSVEFSYRQGKPALAAIDPTVPARTTVTFIGSSGAGKSPLADIVAGLLQPDTARITVDGIPLEGPIRRAWRHQIAYIPQETFLLHDTVRALLRRPQLLILDEATSALDNERATQEVLEALHGNLTLLVIAHRQATVRHADQVVALERSRIVETGTWAELAGQDDGFLLRCSPDSPSDERALPVVVGRIENHPVHLQRLDQSRVAGSLSGCSPSRPVNRCAASRSWRRRATYSGVRLG
jgi:ABC-type multidrug transport system fused ATPase/permease subunit